MKNQIKPLGSVTCALAAAGLFIGTSAQAGLFFWDNGGASQDYTDGLNWNPDAGPGLPGPADLAVHNTGLPAIQITSNVGADSLRLSDGGAVNHTAGTMTIHNGVGPDNGLWVGEFGPGPTSYTLSGAGSVVQIDDPVDGFMIGRAGGSVGTFTLNAGTLINLAGDTHIGLDGTATWNQSSGTFSAAGLHIGRFQSPNATMDLSGNAIVSTAFLLMSDAADGFVNAIQSDLNITGSGVTLDAANAVFRSKANVNFVADAAGVSAIGISGGIFELFSGAGSSDLTVDLSSFGGAGDVVLFDSTTTAAVGTFNGLAEGAVVPGAGGRSITYVGGIDGFDIVLLVPEPSSFALMGLGSLALVAYRNRRKA